MGSKVKEKKKVDLIGIIKISCIVVGLIAVIISAPYVMAILLPSEKFVFALGSVDSWIMFWGTYLVGIIGAGALIWVTNHQGKVQRKAQVEALRQEHERARERKMEQKYLSTQIEKIEEFYQVLIDYNDTTEEIKRLVLVYENCEKHLHLLTDKESKNALEIKMIHRDY